MNLLISPIAHMESVFPDKFGIPRQSGLAQGIESRIIFEKPYRSMDSLRGLEGFSLRVPKKTGRLRCARRALEETNELGSLQPALPSDPTVLLSHQFA